jgi:hypothetical protein
MTSRRTPTGSRADCMVVALTALKPRRSDFSWRRVWHWLGVGRLAGLHVRCAGIGGRRHGGIARSRYRIVNGKDARISGSGCHDITFRPFNRQAHTLHIGCDGHRALRQSDHSGCPTAKGGRELFAARARRWLVRGRAPSEERPGDPVQRSAPGTPRSRITDVNQSGWTLACPTGYGMRTHFQQGCVYEQQ